MRSGSPQSVMHSVIWGILLSIIDMQTEVARMAVERLKDAEEKNKELMERFSEQQEGLKSIAETVKRSHERSKQVSKDNKVLEPPQ
jgi:hypothetical protein